MTDATEAVVNFNQVQKDFQQGLVNAESHANEPDQKTVLSDGKPALNLGSPAVKVFCRIKNSVQFSMVTKGIPENVKSQLQHFNTVEDLEVVLYKKALDQYGEECLSPELIELINKYSNSPLAPLVEYEIEKFKKMRAEVVLLMKDNSEEEK